MYMLLFVTLHFPLLSIVVFCVLIIRYKVPIDLNLKENHEGYHSLTKSPATIGQSQVQKAEHRSMNPSAAASSRNADALVAKRKQKAMAIAMNPGQQVAMSAFMMYMSGNNLNIFSISTTSSAILGPLASIFNIEKTFGNLEVDTSMAKLVYLGLNLAWLAVGLYKMSSMRLLPTTSADFAHSIVWKEMMETSSIPPPMI
jgi:ER membrane protein complex subunit 4